MGCASSRPRKAEETLSATLAEPAPHARPKTHNLREPVPEAEKEDVYETPTTASLVSFATGMPVFHGLLTGRSKPLLQYEQVLREAPHIETAVAPEDDSFAPPLGYDPTYGVLAVSDVVMTLRYTVVVIDSPDREGPVRKIVHDVLDVIHNVVNGWSDASEITSINNAKPERPVQCSDAMCLVLDIVDELHQVTEGRFDPTSGVIKLAFDEALNTADRPPLPGELSRFKFATGWTKRLKRENTSITKKNANTIIDLDGVSKGFCIDLIADALHFEGYRSFYIDWAGDIRSVGRHPSGRPWRTAVLEPPALPRLFQNWKAESLDKMLGPQDLSYLVDLDHDVRSNSSSTVNRVGGVACATSGDYYQIRKYGFHHIVTPSNNFAMKASPQAVASVTILASTCAFADGIATAAMTLTSPQLAVEFLERVKKRIPSQMFGYCVLGRGPDAHDPKYRTGHFKRQTPEKDNDEPPSFCESSARDNLQRTRNAKIPTKESLARVMGSLARTPGRLLWGADAVAIDTLIPCSMNPEPKVSFILPLILAETLPLPDSGELSVHEQQDENDDDFRALRFSYEGRHGDEDTVSFRLKVTDIFPFGEAAVVIARVEQCSHGTSGFVRFLLGGVAHAIDLRPHIKYDDFYHRTVVEQAKDVFSELPSTVCVITTKAADGEMYGLTATSLVMSEHAPNSFCFNVMHSSMFFTVFTGSGASVSAYCLDSHGDKLAKDFAERSLVTKEHRTALRRGSLCVMSGVVRTVDTVEDHAMIAAEITQNAFCKRVSTPLIWHRRRYTFFENP